jgi:hypothetical protein
MMAVVRDETRNEKSKHQGAARKTVLIGGTENGWLVRLDNKATLTWTPVE